MIGGRKLGIAVPRLPGVPFPEVTQTQVATPDPSVNDADGESPADPRRHRSPDRPRPRYSPHERLAGTVVALSISPTARLVLQWCLWAASKVDDVDAFGRRGEAYFWRTGPEMARQLGIPLPTLRKALAELKAAKPAGFLRWRRVDEGCQTPAGTRARTTCTVFYLDVLAIRAAVNYGTELARCDLSDHTRVIRPEIVSARNHSTAIEPPKDLSDLISDLSVEPRSQSGASHPQTPAHPATGGCDGFEILDALVDEWWHQLGSRHLPPSARRGNIVGKVRGAIARALTAYGPDDVRDVIDAAADDRIGGKRDRMGRSPFAWCRDRDVWGKGLFGDCFDHLLASARDARARRTRLLERNGGANASIGGGALPTPPPPQDQARINAAGAAAALAVLSGSKSGG